MTPAGHLTSAHTGLAAPVSGKGAVLPQSGHHVFPGEDDPGEVLLPFLLLSVFIQQTLTK